MTKKKKLAARAKRTIGKRGEDMEAIRARVIPGYDPNARMERVGGFTVLRRSRKIP